MPAHDIDPQLHIRILQSELQRSHDRVAFLEDELGIHYDGPPKFRLSQKEMVMLGVLMKRQFCRRSTFMAALYSDLPEVDIPEDRIIDVMMNHLRTKLSHFGIKINTQWGVGWYMKNDEKQKVTNFETQQTGDLNDQQCTTASAARPADQQSCETA